MFDRVGYRKVPAYGSSSKSFPRYMKRAARMLAAAYGYVNRKEKTSQFEVLNYGKYRRWIERDPEQSLVWREAWDMLLEDIYPLKGFVRRSTPKAIASAPDDRSSRFRRRADERQRLTDCRAPINPLSAGHRHRSTDSRCTPTRTRIDPHR